MSIKSGAFDCTLFLPSLLLLVPLSASVAACSLPFGAGASAPRQLLFGYAAENTRNRELRTVVPGIDVRVHAASAGVNLGWSDLTVLCPVEATAQHDEPPPAASPRYAPPLGVSWHSADGTKHLLGLVLFESGSPPRGEEAVFLHHLYGGVAVGFGSVLQGVEVGLGSTTVLSVPQDAPGFYVLRYASRARSSASFVVGKEGFR